MSEVNPVRSVPGSVTARLSKMDALEWLSAIPDASVDLVITDPPYESLEKHRAIGTTTRLSHSKSSSNDWFPVFANDLFPALFGHLYRVLKKNSHLYLFCDPETAFIAKPTGESAGFRFWKPLIWDKQKIGMGYHYRSRYEFILFFEKGKRKLKDLGVSDILSAPRIRGGYPTEKPVSLSEVLIRQSTCEGDLIIDPFMGSGSVGVAALGLDRTFAGSDVNQAAVDLTASRLREVPGGGTVDSDWRPLEPAPAGLAPGAIRSNRGKKAQSPSRQLELGTAVDH